MRQRELLNKVGKENSKDNEMVDEFFNYESNIDVSFHACVKEEVI